MAVMEKLVYPDSSAEADSGSKDHEGGGSMAECLQHRTGRRNVADLNSVPLSNRGYEVGVSCFGKLFPKFPIKKYTLYNGTSYEKGNDRGQVHTALVQEKTT